MARQTVTAVPFGGLAASVDPALVPLGRFAAMEGASVERGVLETGPRFGDAWSRPGAASGDVGRGVFFGAYALNVEWLGVVRSSGETTCRAYSITEAGVWTELAGGLPDGVWTFRQYEDRVYACCAGAGIWVHTVGWTAPTDNVAGNLKFERFAPTYSGVIAPAAIDTLRPGAAYPTRPWAAPDGITSFATENPVGTSITTSAAFDGFGRIKLSTSTGSAGRRTFVRTVVITLPATLDLTGVDFVQYNLATGDANSGSYGLDGGQSGPTPNTGSDSSGPSSSAPNLGTVEEQYFALSPVSDTTASSQAWADNLPRAALSIYTASDSTEKAVVCDLRTIPATARAAVKRIAIRVAVSWQGNAADLRVTPLNLGGAAIYEWAGSAPDAPDQDYAVVFANPASGALTTATKATLGRPQAGGAKVAPSLRPLGAWPRALEPENSTLFAQGYTKVRLYRFRTLAGGSSWRLVDEQPNVGNPSGMATLVDKVGVQDVDSKPTASLDFGDVPSALVADAFGVWKTHSLILSQRLLFASWAGEPTRYLPPPDQDYLAPEEDDLTQGRTLRVTADYAEGAVSTVEGDLLYLFSKRSGASVMIGDSMLDATPPRRLPGSKGVLGPLAACAHDAGALVASVDALWYLEATRSFTGSSDGTYQIQEVTEKVRDAWRRLAQAGGENVLVASWEDEAWIFGGGRYLRLTRPLSDGARAWEEGPFPAVASFSAAAGHGARAMLADGRVVRLWRDASGVRYESDGGAAFDWSATTGWFPSERRVLVQAIVRAKGSPTLRIESRDRVKGVVAQTIQIEEGRTIPANVGRQPGAEHRLTFSGRAGRDAFLDLALVWEDAGGGQGS